MGLFEVKVKLASLDAPARSEELSLLVDTGQLCPGFLEMSWKGLVSEPFLVCHLHLPMDVRLKGKPPQCC